MSDDGNSCMAWRMDWRLIKALDVDRTEAPLVRRLALPTALTVAYTFLPAATAAIFKTFSCEDFEDGSSLLRMDYGLTCLSDEHAAMESFSILMGCLWFPMPFLVFPLVLHVHRDELMSEWTRNDPELNWFRFLFSTYKPEFYWFENWVFFYRYVRVCAHA